MVSIPQSCSRNHQSRCDPSAPSSTENPSSDLSGHEQLRSFLISFLLEHEQRGVFQSDVNFVLQLIAAALRRGPICTMLSSELCSDRSERVAWWIKCLHPLIYWIHPCCHSSVFCLQSSLWRCLEAFPSQTNKQTVNTFYHNCSSKQVISSFPSCSFLNSKPEYELDLFKV